MNVDQVENHPTAEPWGAVLRNGNASAAAATLAVGRTSDVAADARLFRGDF
jgi:hypothetical protein